MSTSQKPTAVGYLRTSSATNVGPDKDSGARQRTAIEECARVRGFEIVAWFHDEGVPGSDPIEARPGFRELLARLLSNGCRTIIVENASRFSRDLLVQEAGYRLLRAQGIQLIAADSPDSFLNDGPSATLIRQILGATAQFEKSMLVAKLKGARDRKSAQLGRRIEGAKWMQDPARNPAAPQAHVDAARALHACRLSLRAISADLAAQGFLARNGKPYSAQSIKVLLKRGASSTAA